MKGMEFESPDFEGRIIFDNNFSSSAENSRLNNQNDDTIPAQGKDIFLNRMLSLVNEFYLPKSTISVAYTTKQHDKNVVKEEPLQSKATITDLPVSFSKF